MLSMEQAGFAKKGGGYGTKGIVVQDGYEFFADRRMVTLFSAPHYCGQFDNSAATMRVDADMKVSFTTYRPSSRPLLPPPTSVVDIDVSMADFSTKPKAADKKPPPEDPPSANAEANEEAGKAKGEGKDKEKEMEKAKETEQSKKLKGEKAKEAKKADESEKAKKHDKHKGATKKDDLGTKDVSDDSDASKCILANNFCSRKN